MPFVYLNYAFDFQDPIGSYGEKNQAFLQETSKNYRYNPEGLFQKGVPGGFKLFKWKRTQTELEGMECRFFFVDNRR